MSDPMAIATQLGHIAYFIAFPILVLIGLGFLLQRLLGLEMRTLIRLNFYVAVPSVIYTRLVTSQLSGADVVTVVIFHLLAMASWAALTLVVAVARRVPRDQRRAMVMTTIFYNSGNYGLPLQDLAFRAQGQSNAAIALQVFTMVTQNLSSFTLGIFLAAGRFSGEQMRKNVGHILSFPPVYALSAAGLTVLIRHGLGDQAPPVAAALRPIWAALNYMADGFVVIALVTLGAKLAEVRRGGAKYPVSLSVALRLLAGPAMGLALIYLLGWQDRGFIAQVLLISCATPTSVNCMLLCLEFDNHPDYVARSVFYSTLLSPLTVTGVILLSRSGVIGG